MSEQEEWGPVIKHDGSGCPCKGQYVRSTLANGQVADHIAGGFTTDHATGEIVEFDPYATNLWNWDACANDLKWDSRLVEYRIRKPRGISILIAILREVERDGGKGYDVVDDKQLEEAE